MEIFPFSRRVVLIATTYWMSPARATTDVDLMPLAPLWEDILLMSVRPVRITGMQLVQTNLTKPPLIPIMPF